MQHLLGQPKSLNSSNRPAARRAEELKIMNEHRKGIRWLRPLRGHLNFYRIHMLSFILVPLFAACIFYVLNDARTSTQPFVSFIDSLFLCISAATVAGLYTVVLSNLNVGQQIILALLTAVGSYSFVSAITVVIRRQYFMDEMRKKLANRNAAVDEKPANIDQNTVTPRSDAEVQLLHDRAGPHTTLPSEENQSGPPSDKGFIKVGGGPILYSDQFGTGEGVTPYRRRTEGIIPNSRTRGVPLTRSATYKDRGIVSFEVDHVNIF